jgi:hypothetical protein
VSDFNSLKRSFYQRVCYCPSEPKATELVHSDIVLHLPVLEFYASLCGHVTEFGVREGCSTAALLAGCKGEMHSYDIEHTPVVDRLQGMTLPCSWTFHRGDTGDPALEVAETDLLFIDTLHTYDHVTKELTHHGRKARKFLAFHDTFTCGEVDASGPNPTARGIVPAINEFMSRFPGEYETAFATTANNGLLVLRRVSH